MKKYMLYIAFLCSLGSASSFAEFSPAETKDIQNVIQEYLLEKPEILIEMQIALQNKQNEAHQESLSAALDYIHKTSDIPSLGNKENPKVTLTEFIDYSCGYCKLMWPETKKLTAEYPDLQIRVVNIPILGPYSRKAASYSAAVNILYPNKWDKFHDELMSAKSQLSEKALKNLVGSLDGDWEEVLKVSQSDKVTQILNNNLDIAEKSAIQGTPFYALDAEHVFRGAVGYESLKDAIENDLKNQ